MRTRRRPARDLRIAIDCLPLQTRKAMLSGIAANRIIVGAYVDRGGGVCPMLAAHRNGGRTSLASFAHAWDRYTRARKARPATDRELNTLRTMLEASIALDEVGRLADVPRPAKRQLPDTGERSRLGELRGQEGWAWLRPVRRLDEYERALAELQLIEGERGEREPAPV
jgi:hypothetical protein